MWVHDGKMCDSAFEICFQRNLDLYFQSRCDGCPIHPWRVGRFPLWPPVLCHFGTQDGQLETDPSVLVDIYGHIASRALFVFNLLRKAVSMGKDMNVVGG